MITIWNELIWHVALHFPVLLHLISFHSVFPSSLLFCHTSAFSSTHKQPHKTAAHPDANSLTSWGEILNREEEVNQTWESELVKEGTPKGGAEKFRAWAIEQTATFHHQNSNKKLFRRRKKKPWTVSICFGGWKAGGEIKQAFDISVMYKREPYSWEDTLVNKHFLYSLFILYSLPMHTYTSVESVPAPHCIWIRSPCAFVVFRCLSVLVSRVTVSYFFDKISPSVINLQTHQPVAQHIATKTFSVSIYFPFLPLCSITGQTDV